MDSAGNFECARDGVLTLLCVVTIVSNSLGVGCFFLCPEQVNAAEAEFWRRSQGNRIDFSDKILGFECGGQQWVNEVCFPAGTLREPNGKDLDYMVSEDVHVF